MSGIALVEMDYLHETASPIPHINPYPHEAESYPYSVVVTNPRPSLDSGDMRVYGFSVDTPLPVIVVPLADADSITLDLNSVYNRTFESFASFSRRVDYAALPDRFESYSPADQERIRQRMSAAQMELQQ
jgi:hypothetical protein